MRKILLFLALAFCVSNSAEASVYQQFNGPPGPGPAFWGLSDIGWYWTPNSDLELDAIQTQLASGFSNINNNFTFTTTLYTDRPDVGGSIIDSVSWNGATPVDGAWVGDSFSSSISLTGGTTYFIGFSGWENALGWNGPNSGAGINWVFYPNGSPNPNPDPVGTDNLGAGSSYFSSVSGSGSFNTQLSPSGLGTTDQAILRFIEADTPPTGAVPEPSMWIVLGGLGLCFGVAGWWRKRQR